MGVDSLAPFVTDPDVAGTLPICQVMTLPATELGATEALPAT